MKEARREWAQIVNNSSATVAVKYKNCNQRKKVRRYYSISTNRNEKDGATEQKHFEI